MFLVIENRESRIEILICRCRYRRYLVYYYRDGKCENIHLQEKLPFAFKYYNIDIPAKLGFETELRREVQDLDIFVPEDNLEAGFYVLSKYGTLPWHASRPCWIRAINVSYSTKKSWTLLSGLVVRLLGEIVANT